MSEDEIKALEKKKWIEIKDLIFETDASVLDYLSWHCRRVRKAAAGGLDSQIRAAQRSKSRTNKKAKETV